MEAIATSERLPPSLERGVPGPREIRGFMTVCCIGHFDEVLAELIECLVESGLYARSASVELAVLGDAAGRERVLRAIRPFRKLRVAHWSADVREYEFPALELLQVHARRSDGFVYYLHTKGVSHPRTNQYQHHWRRLMLYHVVEQHERCLSALEMHDTVGTVWKGDHYSGNFWWARTEHIRRLPPIGALRETPRSIAWEPVMNLRVQCEYWIGMSAARFASMGPESVHLYDHVRWTHSASDIVNWLLAAVGGRRYLELTMSSGLSGIAAAVRHVVSTDPAASHRMTETDFFESAVGEASYDVIFVDVVHEADRCLYAIERALDRLAPHGAIVVHDTNPPSQWHQRPLAEYEWGSDWNGDVWKAVVRFRERHPELSVSTVDTDWGCTVIRPAARSGRRFEPPVGVLDWERFVEHRGDWLNLVSVRRLRRDLWHVPYGVGLSALHDRTDVLNVLVSRFDLKRYLEIGVAEPARNFARIIAPIRQSVDPNGRATFEMTSDEFFASGAGCEQYDLIFVDGLHEAEQCLRDIEHALSRLSPYGFIVVHDANPPTEWHQRPAAEFEPGSDWNGTAWQAVVRFRLLHPECELWTVDLDWGCAVIRRTGAGARPARLAVEAADLDWPAFVENRSSWLNLISAREFLDMSFE